VRALAQLVALLVFVVGLFTPATGNARETPTAAPADEIAETWADVHTGVTELANALCARDSPLAAGGGGPKRLLPELKIGKKQFGKKVGKHAEEFGLDARNPAHRTEVRDRIEDIIGRYDEVRQGPWNPQGGGGTDFLFYRQGSDIVITKPSGDFVTVLPGGTNNGWFNAAKSLF